MHKIKPVRTEADYEAALARIDACQQHSRQMHDA